MKNYLLFFVIAACARLFAVHGVPLSEGDNNVKSNQTHDKDIFVRLAKCSLEGGLTGIVNCAAQRVLRSLDIANSEQIIPIFPGITFESDSPRGSRSAKILTETEPLPVEPEKKKDKLFKLLLDATTKLFSGRSLKIKLGNSTTLNMARALEEGRAKMKKMVGPLMLGLGATTLTMVPIMMAGLAMLTAKAMIIGKMALVVSLILFVQYFFSKNPNTLWNYYNPTMYGPPSVYGPPYGTNNLGGWAGGVQFPYARSINVDPSEEKETTTSHNLVYAGYK